MIEKRKKERLTAWWNNEDLGEPVFLFKDTRKNNHIPDTDNLREYWTDQAFHIKKAMQIIDSTDYLADSVPYHYVDFGGLPLCACLGGELDFIDKNATWNRTFVDETEQLLGLDVKEDNVWWQLIKDVTTQSAKLSAGHHYTTHCAFSGVGDVASGCMGIDSYMIALIEEPETVKLALSHMCSIWERLFHELNDIIKSGGNEGFVSSWTGIWAPGTTFPIQEDISYMISGEMFREFSLPYIERQTQCMEYPMYHLDGKGQISFVDDIASLSRMRAVQWLPGAGNWGIRQWLDLIKHIKSLGTAVQVFAHSMEEIELLINEVGTKGLLVTVEFDNEQENDKFIEKYSLYD